MNKKSKKVFIIYKYIPQYRREFFEQLRNLLGSGNIELKVFYGQPGKIDGQKKDAIELPWGNRINNRLIRLDSRELIWQPILPRIKDADLIIVEQASKLLVNYLLVGLNILKIKKVAFWGHGKNLQTENASRLGEFLKRVISTRVHWWFTYNRKSTEIIKQLGFPESHIIEVQNAIDVRQLQNESNKYSPEDVADIKKNLGITGNHVGLYVGGMYPEKRLDFLLISCEIIRENIPDFEMIFIGDGPLAYLVEEKSKAHSWIHYLGPIFGNERIPYFLLSKVFLMPGLVGLAILDCFALEVPLVTTNNPNHSPEIDYLEPGFNGVMIEYSNDPNDYAKAVITVLTDDNLRQQLISGCRTSASVYSMEAMVKRFGEGIQKALSVDN